MLQKINSLQVFRGLAAIAVVAHHTNTATAAFIEDVPTWVDNTLSHGYLGVDFFFVLSGFIIMYSHMQDDKSLANTKRYLFKRLTRIFPAYLPISLGLIFLYIIIPELSASGGREYSLLSSLLLLPDNQPPALSVAWTLIHELIFYFIFLSYFISRRLFAIILGTWFLSIFFFHQETNRLNTYFLSPLNIEFMFGVTIAVIFRKYLSMADGRWQMADGSNISNHNHWGNN